MTDPSRTVAPVTPSAADPHATTGELTAPVAKAPPASPTRYALGDEIARGGMGEVYRATDTVLSREVAVKVLQAKFDPTSATARRFDDEARITAQLQHPNIPAVHDLGTLPDGRPFLAMKLIKGQTLDALLKARPDPTHDRGRFVAVFEGICQAVAYAHAHGVIHRDLKPANVMVGGYGEVQVMDWGLAKVLGPGTRNASDGVGDSDPDATADPDPTEIKSLRDSDLMTHDGSVLGTPAYMAPEQAIGAVDKIDRRTDVFGLGGVLAVILTGHPPFQGPTAESTRQLAAMGKVADCFAQLDASGAEPDLVALCKRCLAPEPSDRPADAGEVAKAVGELRAAADERARRAEIDRATATVQEAEQQKRRRVLQVAGGVVAAVLLTAVGVAVVLMLRAMSAEKATGEQLVKTEAAKQETGEQLAKTQAAEADAQAKRQEAQAALVKANERTKSLSDAYGDFVFGIQNRLENRPGTQDLRKQLLETARNGLKKILDDARKQGTPDSTLVWSHLRMGELELTLGNTEAAKREYDEGHAIAQKLAVADPTNALAQRDLSISFNRLGDVTLRLGQTKNALDWYQRCHTLVQKLADADPTDARALRDLSVSFDKLGDVTLRLGQTKNALGFYQKGLDTTQRLAEADPKSTQTVRDLSVSFDKLGDVTLRLGQTKNALGWFQKCNAHSQRLADADPTDAQAQRDLGVSFNKLGDVTSQLGQAKAALDFYQKGRDISQKLADADPKDARAQRDLSVSFNKLGDVTLQLGQAKAALAFYQKGLDATQKRVDSDPTNAQASRDLSVSFERLGDVTLELGQAKDALDFYRQGLDIDQKLADADPTDARAQRDLSVSFERLGDVTLELGQAKGALDLYKRGLGIRQKLTDADPTNAQARRDLSVSFNKLGDVTLQLGQAKDALDFYQQGRDIRQKLADADPKNVRAQRDLAISFDSLGQVHLALSDPVEAAKWYEKLIAHIGRQPDPKALNLDIKSAEDGLANCRQAEKALADLDFVLKQPAKEVPGLLDIRVKVFTKKGDAKNLLATAEAWEKLAAKDDTQIYDAACAWSLLCGVSKDDAKLRDEYAGKALALLRKSPMGKGQFFETPAALVEHMKKDADLDPLRDRDDFKKLLADLEAKSPPREVLPTPRADK